MKYIDGINSLVSDSRDIITLPNLTRSTLMDQIDYSLANFKLSEFSIDNKLADQIKDLRKFNSKCLQKEDTFRVTPTSHK